MVAMQSKDTDQRSPDAPGPHSMGDILAALDRLGKERGRVSIGDMAERFGRRSYGPFLLIPALIEISPIGGIPAVPTFLAAILALVAIQLLFRRKHIYLPPLIRNRSLKGIKVSKAVRKLEGFGNFMDGWFHGRLRPLLHPPMPQMAGGVIVLLCATVPPLELVPFASTAPMLAIASFGLALLVRDGLLMMMALVLSGAAIIGGIALAASSASG